MTRVLAIFPSRMRGIVEFHRERMQVDVAVGAVVRAQAAADAPVFDDDLERVAAADRADRAADHAQRIAALAAGSGDQVFVEAQTFADQAGDAVVGIGASAYALIAARAALQVENQQALGFHQAVGEKLINWQRLQLSCAAAILRGAFLCNGLEFGAHFREALEHQFKVSARDAYDFHVVECRAGGGPWASAEQGDLAEISAAREVSEDQLAVRDVLRTL